MPNLIDATGLSTATSDELIATLTTGLELIYGNDIDLASNTPDGQQMRLFIQMILDMEDLLVQIYNMFDPDNAIGVILDQRCAINGIQRQAGTNTVTNVTIVTSQALNLYGLDQTAQPVFTVSDNAGNLFQLVTTVTIATASTNVLVFQAAVPGAVLTIPNTITVPVTIVLGVTSINNPTAATTTGINEETDAALKVRRQKSVSLASQGYLSGLLAALENINGVTSAFIFENTSASTNADGVPGHSIWVIVAGTAASADIANAIYTKRNAGCGMYGATSYVITQVDGSSFIILYDTVDSQNLFIAFTATSIDGINAPNIAAIISGLVANYVPGVNEEVNINQLSTIVQQIDANTLVTGAGFSTGLTQVMTLSGIAASGTFVINCNGHASAAINWNDAIATIQTKVQAVTGLAGTLVTGSIASQTLTFVLPSPSAPGLLTITSNSLATVAPAAITFTANEGYSNTLAPSSKKNQFAVAAANIVILPMILSPPTAIVPRSTTKQLTGLGGYGTLVYSLLINNSGGSINASTGVYTAGPTPNVIDTVKVTDAFGNSATALMTVS